MRGRGLSKPPKKPMPGKNGTQRISTSFAAATWLAGCAPHWLLYVAAQIGGGIHYWLAADKREAYLANTRGRVEFGRGRRPWGAFQNQALNVLELLKAHSESGDELLSRTALHGAEHIDQALARGRGVVLATFHSGNWELSGLMLALSGYPITTVAGEQLRAGWSEAVKDLKRRTGIRVLSPNAGLRELFRDLRRNRVVVLHIDGDLFDTGTPVRFLGHDILAPRGPARLARVIGSPVALAYCRRNRRKHLHVFVETPEAPPVSRAAEDALTAELMARVENRIVEDPTQWCIFRRLT